MANPAVSVALINYYARLIRKGSYNISEVPEDARDAVLTKVAELGPLEKDPITQTPKED